MTTTTEARSTTSEIRKAGFGRLLQSEWTKIRSVRSTVWALLILVLIDLAFTTLLCALVASQWDNASPSDKAATVADPTAFVLGGGLSLGQLAVCVLGVMVIASEYSTGMIRASLLAVPRRLPMLAAKAVVFGVLILVLGTVVSFASFFIGSGLMHDKAPVSLSDPGVLRAVFGGGLYLAMLGLFALALGAIIRHTAAGITGVIGFVLVLAPLAALLPGSLGKHVHAYLPSEAGQLIVRAHQAKDGLLTPWQGFGVFAIWTAVLLIIAAVQLRRRDA